MLYIVKGQKCIRMRKNDWKRRIRCGGKRHTLIGFFDLTLIFAVTPCKPINLILEERRIRNTAIDENQLSLHHIKAGTQPLAQVSDYGNPKKFYKGTSLVLMTISFNQLNTKDLVFLKYVL